MARFFKLIGSVLASLGLTGYLAAAEWQWSVPEGEGRAFLWAPPACEKIRAVVVAPRNLLEDSVLEHPAFRKELADRCIAAVWVVPGFEGGVGVEDGSDKRLFAILKSLAEESGYDELADAPVVPMGHSACATFPWNFAAMHPERTLAVLSVKGDAPQTPLTGNGRPRMDWGNRNIDGIPGLFVIGEYEWMDERVLPGLEFKKRHPASCIAMLAEPGEGHFDASDELVGFLAMFLGKAAEARLPEGGETKLRKVNPGDGWLVQRWRLREKRTVPAAPAADYTGDAEDAFWAFDEETARAIETMHEGRIGKKPQLLGFVQEGRMLPQVEHHQQVDLRFLPEEDGVSFTLGTGFLKQVEAVSGNLSRWTALPAGAPLGHVGSGETRVRRITGPFRETGDGRFELALDRTWSTTDKRNHDLWFVARHPGDETYTSAVQQALMKLPENTGGTPQVIRIERPRDVKRGEKHVTLKASSDSGLPVRFFVREGPAVVHGDTLEITDIPRRAKFPVRVTVTAWQWGDAEHDTAAVVETSFYILP